MLLEKRHLCFAHPAVLCPAAFWHVTFYLLFAFCPQCMSPGDLSLSEVLQPRRTWVAYSPSFITYLSPGTSCISILGTKDGQERKMLERLTFLEREDKGGSCSSRSYHTPFFSRRWAVSDSGFFLVPCMFSSSISSSSLIMVFEDS